MIHRTVEDYAAAQKDLCVQNDFIPNSLFQEYGVNRGLHDDVAGEVGGQGPAAAEDVGKLRLLLRGGQVAE